MYTSCVSVQGAQFSSLMRFHTVVSAAATQGNTAESDMDSFPIGQCYLNLLGITYTHTVDLDWGLGCRNFAACTRHFFLTTHTHTCANTLVPLCLLILAKGGLVHHHI